MLERKIESERASEREREREEREERERERERDPSLQIGKQEVNPQEASEHSQPASNKHPAHRSLKNQLLVSFTW